jgi:cytidine deaminase
VTDKAELLVKAQAAKEMAVAPTSKFMVGAALLCDDGTVFTGCNIESPTYLGICAERVALFKALSEGRRGFKTIAIAGGANGGCPPCGACRQVLWEFAPGLEVLLEDGRGGFTQRSTTYYFPEPFDRSKVDPSRAAGQ